MKANAAFSPAVLDKVLGATAMNVTPDQARLYETETNFQVSPVHVNGAENCYDILRTNVNKGYSIEKILDLLGIAPEHTIAFGDGMNDKEMLQTVGEGFAMGNAHDDLFKYAKHQTATVNEEGIARGLEQLGMI